MYLPSLIPSDFTKVIFLEVAYWHHWCKSNHPSDRSAANHHWLVMAGRREKKVVRHGGNIHHSCNLHFTTTLNLLARESWNSFEPEGSTAFSCSVGNLVFWLNISLIDICDIGHWWTWVFVIRRLMTQRLANSAAIGALAVSSPLGWIVAREPNGCLLQTF